MEEKEKFDIVEYYRNTAGIIPEDNILANIYQAKNLGEELYMPTYEQAKKTYKAVYKDEFKEEGFKAFYNNAKDLYRKYDKMEFNAEDNTLPYLASPFRTLYYGQTGYDITGQATNERKKYNDFGIDLNPDINAAVYGNDYETPYESMIKSKDINYIQNSKYRKVMDYTQKAKENAEKSGITYLYDEATDDVLYNEDGTPKIKQRNPEDLDFSFSGIFSPTTDTAWALRFDKNTGKPLMVEIDNTVDQYKVTDRKSVWSNSSMNSDFWALPVTAGRIVPNIIGNLSKAIAYTIDNVALNTLDNVNRNNDDYLSKAADWFYKVGSNISAEKNLDSKGSAFDSKESFVANIGQGVESYLPIVALSLAGMPNMGIAYGGLEAARGAYEDGVQNGMTERESSLFALTMGSAAMLSGKLLEGKWLNEIAKKTPLVSKTIFADTAKELRKEVISNLGEKGVKFANKFAQEQAIAQETKALIPKYSQKLYESFKVVKDKLIGFRDKLDTQWLGKTLNQANNEGLEELSESIVEESYKALYREYGFENQIYETIGLEGNKREARFLQSMKNGSNSFSEKKWEDLMMSALETYVVGGVVGGITSAPINFLNRKDLEKKVKDDLILKNVLDGKTQDLLEDADKELELIKNDKSSLGSTKFNSKGEVVDRQADDWYKETEAYYNWKLTKDRINTIDTFVKGLKIDEKLKDNKMSREFVEKQLADFLDKDELQKEAYVNFIDVYSKQTELDDLIKPNESNNESLIPDFIKNLGGEEIIKFNNELKEYLKENKTTTQQEYLEKLFEKQSNSNVEKEVEKSSYGKIYQLQRELNDVNYQIGNLSNDNIEQYEELVNQRELLNDAIKKAVQKYTVDITTKSNPEQTNKIKSIADKLLEIQQAQFKTKDTLTDDLYKTHLQQGYLNALKQQLEKKANEQPKNRTDEVYTKAKLDWLNNTVFNKGTKANADGLRQLNKARKLQVYKMLNEAKLATEKNKAGLEEAKVNRKNIEDFLKGLDFKYTVQDGLNESEVQDVIDDFINKVDAYNSLKEKLSTSLLDKDIDFNKYRETIKGAMQTVIDTVSKSFISNENKEILIGRLEDEGDAGVVKHKVKLFENKEAEIPTIQDLDLGVSLGKFNNGNIAAFGVEDDITMLEQFRQEAVASGDVSQFLSAVGDNGKSIYDLYNQIFANEVLSDMNVLVNNQLLSLTEKTDFKNGDMLMLEVKPQIDILNKQYKDRLELLYEFYSKNANDRYAKDDSLRKEYIKSQYKQLKDFFKEESVLNVFADTQKKEVLAFKQSLEAINLDEINFSLKDGKAYIDLLKKQQEFVALFNTAKGLNQDLVQRFVEEYVIVRGVEMAMSKYSYYNTKTSDPITIEKKDITEDYKKKTRALFEDGKYEAKDKSNLSNPPVITIFNTLTTALMAMQNKEIPNIISLFGLDSKTFYKENLNLVKDTLPSLEQETVNKSITSFLNLNFNPFEKVINRAKEQNRKFLVLKKTPVNEVDLDRFFALNTLYVKGSGGTGKTAMVSNTSLNVATALTGSTKRIGFTAPFEKQINNLEESLNKSNVKNTRRFNKLAEIINNISELDIILLDEGTILNNDVLVELLNTVNVENQNRLSLKKPQVKLVVLGDDTQLVAGASGANLSSNQIFANDNKEFDKSILKVSTPRLTQKFRNNYIIFDLFDEFFEVNIREGINAKLEYDKPMYYDDGNILNRHGLNYQTEIDLLNDFVLHYNANLSSSTPQSIAFIIHEQGGDTKTNEIKSFLTSKGIPESVVIDAKKINIIYDSFTAQGSEFDIVYGAVYGVGNSKETNETLNRATRVIGSRRKNYLSLLSNTITNVPKSSVPLSKYNKESIDSIKSRNEAKQKFMKEIIDNLAEPTSTSASNQQKVEDNGEIKTDGAKVKSQPLENVPKEEVVEIELDTEESTRQKIKSALYAC
jgi:hypothetical protein